MKTNPISWANLTNSFHQFMTNALRFAEELNLDVSSLVIDHVAIRIKDAAVVDTLREELSNLSIDKSPISNEIVNGREILIFKLSTPLKFQRFEIPCVELPYPAQIHEYKCDGWEHLEFVIPSDARTEIDFEKDFYKKFPDFDKTNPAINLYKVSMPVVENQPPNPTVVIQKELGLAIKFHPKSIEEIVRGKSMDQNK